MNLKGQDSSYRRNDTKKSKKKDLAESPTERFMLNVLYIYI